MDYSKIIFHETLLYAFAFLIARLIGYPLLNVTNILRQEAARKKDQDDKKQNLMPTFSFSLKLKYISDALEKSGSGHLLFKGWQYYVIPSVAAAIGEGVGFNASHLYLQKNSNYGRIITTYICIVICCVTGSMTLFITREILNLGLIQFIGSFIKTPVKFIKTYNILHFEYQFYAIFQAVFDVVLLFSFNQINFFTKIIGFLCGRNSGTLSVIPVSHLWPLMPNIAENALKKYKAYGLRYFFQGAIDAVHIEIVISLTFIISFKILHLVFPVIYS